MNLQNGQRVFDCALAFLQVSEVAAETVEEDHGYRCANLFRARLRVFFAKRGAVMPTLISGFPASALPSDE